jgi:DNA modification methylase
VEQILHLVAADLVVERPDGSDEDVHFPRALAHAVINGYSSPGEMVLDPFAGWGTTLLVAEKLGRRAVGVELVPERVGAIRKRLSASAVVLEADARHLDSLDLGQIDLCFTSPPYMTAVEHPQNPLTGYSTLDGNYETYLTELTGVFLKVASHLRTGGHLVINAANIRTGQVVTPLAWDITHALIPHLAFRGETYLAWDQPPPSFTGDYCLAFQKT